jgi:hypothetical protein
MGCITFHIKTLLILTMKIYRAGPTFVKGADAFNAVFGFGFRSKDKDRRRYFPGSTEILSNSLNLPTVSHSDTLGAPGVAPRAPV